MTCDICHATDHGDERGAYAWRPHFDAAFTNGDGQPYDVPADIRSAAERITQSYNIRGICDPMYIANVIALETGRGDGCSTFTAQAVTS